MEYPNIDAIKEQVAKVEGELDELEAKFSQWNHQTPGGAKFPRSIARRIVLSAQHLESLVKENTYTPGA